MDSFEDYELAELFKEDALAETTSFYQQESPLLEADTTVSPTASEVTSTLQPDSRKRKAPISMQVMLTPPSKIMRNRATQTSPPPTLRVKDQSTQVSFFDLADDLALTTDEEDDDDDFSDFDDDDFSDFDNLDFSEWHTIINRKRRSLPLKIEDERTLDLDSYFRRRSTDSEQGSLDMPELGEE